MSTPGATGAGRPLRTAGLALLGLAALSLVIGLVSLVAGGSGDPTAGDAPARPATPSTDSATSAPTRPSTTVAPASPSPPPPGRPGAAGGATPAPPGAGPVVPPPGTDVGAGTGAGEKGEATRSAVRVYNNGTTRGLATQAADDLTAAGWSVIEVGNYSGGRIPTTTVYYQPGTGQLSSAEQLGQQFEMRVEPRFTGIRDARPGLVVIVTNDYAA